MTKQDTTAGVADMAPIEANLGKVLVLIHRILPRLDEIARAPDVQIALKQATTCLEAARLRHEQAMGTGRTVAGAQRVATGVAPEIAAVIAAVVSVLFDRPYRLVSVQQVETPVPYLNVWALEGRTQIFQSHKIR
jgi:hypothetical protein